MTPVEVLEGALKLLLSKKRWTKGTLCKTDRGVACYCAEGALRFVTFGKLFCSHEERALLAPVRFFLGKGTSAIDLENWNDHSRRTHKQVLAAFRKAIVRAKAAQ